MLTGILVLSAGLRLLYSFFPVSACDGGTYLVNAKYILDGSYFFSSTDYFPILYRTPGYPLFLAAVLSFTSSFKAAVIIQHLLGLASAGLVFLLALRLWKNVPAALLACAFAGLHFHFVYLESYLLSESLAVFLTCAGLWSAVYLKQEAARARPAFYAACGLTWGLAVLCKPELAPFPLLTAFYLRGEPGANILKRWAGPLLFLLPAVLLAGGWVLRNGLVYNYWGLTPNSAFALYGGPAGLCIDWDKAEKEIVPQTAKKHDFKGGGGNKLVFFLQKYKIEYPWTSRKVSRLALAGAAGRPGLYLKEGAGTLAGLLAERDWPLKDETTETIPALFNEKIQGRLAAPRGLLPRVVSVDSFLEFLLLAPLFIAGILLAVFRKAGREEGLFLAAFPAYLLLVYSFISLGGTRYRVLAEPAMGILAAFAAVRLAEALFGKIGKGGPALGEALYPPALAGWEHRLLKAAAVPALAAACLLYSIFIFGLAKASIGARLEEARLAGEIGRSSGNGALDENGWARLGWYQSGRGNLEKAVACFGRALELKPGSPQALEGRGLAYFQMAEGRLALKDLDAALAASPGKGDLRYNLAILHSLLGNKKEAAAHLERLLSDKTIPDFIRAEALSILRELRNQQLRPSQ